LRQRLAAASDDIRNALVPLLTVAELLRPQGEVMSRSWCVSILRQEVKRVLDILDALSP